MYKIMLRLFTRCSLKKENKIFKGTGGVSQYNRQYRFQPAFRDQDTGKIYPSCNLDGSPAPCHILDGLPANLAIARDVNGRIIAVKHSIIAGFIKEGHFYTREEAAKEVANQVSIMCH